MKSFGYLILLIALALTVQVSVAQQQPATAKFNLASGQFHNKASAGILIVTIENTTATGEQMREKCIPYHQAIEISAVNCGDQNCDVTFTVHSAPEINLLARWLSVHAVNQILFTDKSMTLHEFMMFSSR